MDLIVIVISSVLFSYEQFLEFIRDWFSIVTGFPLYMDSTTFLHYIQYSTHFTKQSLKILYCVINSSSSIYLSIPLNYCMLPSLIFKNDEWRQTLIRETIQIFIKTFSWSVYVHNSFLLQLSRDRGFESRKYTILNRYINP